MWELALSKSGNKTLLYNQYYVHSRINPIVEAEKFIKPYFYNPPPYRTIILGVGLGYFIDLYIQYLNSYSKSFHILCIFMDEEEKKIFYSMFPQYKNQHQVQCILYNNWGDLQKYIDTYFNDYIKLSTIQTIEYHSILRHHQEKLSLFKSKLQELMQYGVQSFATILEFNRIWAKNLLYNIPLNLKYSVSPFISGDVILVSAGYSVLYNLNFLKEQKGKTPIAVVDTVFPLLYYQGIIPDIVISCDAQIDNFYDFFCLTGDINFFKKHQILLIADITVYHKISTLFNKVFFATSENMIPYWKDFFLKNSPCFPAGGSVASFALVALQYLGAGRITLVGQDLQNKPLPHSVDTIHHFRKIFQSYRTFSFFSSMVMWLKNPQVTQDTMLKNLTQWVNDFFKLYPVKGIHKDPSIVLSNIKLWNNETLKGKLSIEEKKTDLLIEIQNKYKNILEYIEKLEYTKNTDEPIFILLMQEYDLKNYVFFLKNKKEGEVFKHNKKQLQQIKKYIRQSLESFH